MSILAASGDIGGGRALLPVLEELAKRGSSFSIVENGFLAGNAPEQWSRVDADLKVIEDMFASKQVTVLVFTSSVKDTLALRVARIGKKHGARVIHLLDNWMNYRQRLEIDGDEMLVPDKYIVMDELAFEEGCAEGIDSDVLEVGGQPALVGLDHQFKNWEKENNRVELFTKLNFDPEKKLIAFISEPAKADHGDDNSDPLFRGYTEKTVLKEFCEKLQPVASKYQIAVIPHPREDAEVVLKQWEACQGKLEGRTLVLESGREAVFLADGVAGMCSILLYEAWLLNKPMISIQPGLCKSHLDIMQKREGAYCIIDDSQWNETLGSWLDKIDGASNKGIRKELQMHVQAPKLIATMIKDRLEADSKG